MVRQKYKKIEVSLKGNIYKMFFLKIDLFLKPEKLLIYRQDYGILNIDNITNHKLNVRISTIPFLNYTGQLDSEED